MKSLLLSALCLFLVACSGGQDPDADPASAPEPTSAGDAVQLELTEAVVENGRLRLQGTTDVPDGAILRYRVEHDGFASGDFDGQLLGELTVANGAFSADMDVDGWPRGHAFTWISMEMHGQPASVVEAYGADGERLAGPDVIRVADGNKVEIKVDVELP
jgi:hypothetical protein